MGPRKVTYGTISSSLVNTLPLKTRKIYCHFCEVNDNKLDTQIVQQTYDKLKYWGPLSICSYRS